MWATVGSRSWPALVLAADLRVCSVLNTTSRDKGWTSGRHQSTLSASIHKAPYDLNACWKSLNSIRAHYVLLQHSGGSDGSKVSVQLLASGIKTAVQQSMLRQFERNEPCTDTTPLGRKVCCCCSSFSVSMESVCAEGMSHLQTHGLACCPKGGPI